MMATVVMLGFNDRRHLSHDADQVGGKLLVIAQQVLCKQ
jgi:hypothetical protein